jgi:tRNA threonylcarbamoyladenosine biosynthesis protein TsaE
VSDQQTAIILETDNPDATRAIGRCLGQLLEPGDVICLQGDLGSGKTCFTQGIGAGMGVAEVINSPTFVFVNEHAPLNAGPYLYHVDLYRMCDLNEVLSLGLEDYMYGDGVTVIEWADRASEMMPAQGLWVHLAYRDFTVRRLTLHGAGQRSAALLQALAQESLVALALVGASE